VLLVIRSNPARIYLFLAGAACAAALAISVLVSPAASVETTNEASASARDCRVVQVSLDEGYSISRVEERRLCP
jgi:hypothetical protein